LTISAVLLIRMLRKHKASEVEATDHRKAEQAGARSGGVAANGGTRALALAETHAPVQQTWQGSLDR
jgi:hypothetical protein